MIFPSLSSGMMVVWSRADDAGFFGKERIHDFRVRKQRACNQSGKHLTRIQAGELKTGLISARPSDGVDIDKRQPPE